MNKKKIAVMGISELRSYLCAKSNGNPAECKNCRGRSGCPAGKRAVELISESERRAAEVKVAMPDSISETVELFRKACESGNAWGYIEKNMNVSKGRAKEILISMINKFPATSLEFGGQKRLLRYRPDSEHESEPETKQKPEKPMRACDKVKRDKALDYWAVALAQPDPVTYYIETRNASRKTARTIVSHARLKYGEMLTDRIEEEKRKMAQQKEEEVSIMDFLGEYETKEEPSPAEPVPEPIPEPVPEPDPVKVGIEEEITRKIEQYRLRVQTVSDEIKRKQELLAAVVGGLKALEEVLEIFKTGK